jgi:outer membrane protein OmpA-like peptidoglycan-associated protein
MGKDRIKMGVLMLSILIVGLFGGYWIAVLTDAGRSQTSVSVSENMKISAPVEIAKPVVKKAVRAKVVQETDEIPKEKAEAIKIEKAKSTSAITMDEFKRSGVVLLFPWNSTYMMDSTKELIKSKFGNVAVELNKDIKLRIEGHTETGGDGSYNRKLSRQRAEAIADYLVSEYGFRKENFVIIGMGGENPFTDGKEESERSLNRRVEIKLN